MWVTLTDMCSTEIKTKNSFFPKFVNSFKILRGPWVAQ